MQLAGSVFGVLVLQVTPNPNPNPNPNLNPNQDIRELSLEVGGATVLRFAQALGSRDIEPRSRGQHAERDDYPVVGRAGMIGSCLIE